jgi:hypothetical protein
LGLNRAGPGPGRAGSQWALKSPVSSAVMLLYHPRLNLEKS